MFQSSRIASGNCSRHSSSACSPSSASTIWKSRPSRIRRATFRMTLESSTTKQVFIVLPSLCSRLIPIPIPAASRRDRLHRDVEHTVDVENHKQLAIEPINSGRYACQSCIEIARIWFPRLIVQLEHLADTVDEQAVGFATRFDADRHRLLAGFATAESEAASHVYQCHDAAAQVQDARHFRRRKRHRGEAFRRKDILHPQDRQTEQLATDQGGHIFVETMVGFLVHAVFCHAAWTTPVCSLSAAIRPWRSNFAT